MVRVRLAGGASLVVLMSVLLVTPGWAQQGNGAIAGIARDTSGGVLPGVTVEAASLALIEKVRTVVTDAEGRYNIVDLRPGRYTVTFTLAGFNNFRREGIVLTSGFTATVNADMQLGSLQETITVTGEAPLVDAQNVRRQTVVSDDLLDVLPSSTKSVNTVVALTPGFTGVVSPSDIYTTTVGANGTFHGKGGTNITMDGMGIQWSTGNIAYQPNTALVEETVLQTSGISADTNADGAVINMVPKEGGNIFSGSIAGLYTNDRLQSDNLTDALRARGLTGAGKVLKVYDATLTFGGPIKPNRLWFFGAVRTYGNGNQNSDTFYNLTQGTPFYTPDASRPGDRYQWYESQGVRLTWQATARHKVNFLVDHQKSCNCRYRPPITTRLDAPEAAHSYMMYPHLLQLTWSAPVTNRLLFESGMGGAIANWPQFRNPGVTINDVAITELTTGLLYNARQTYNDPQKVPRYSQRFSMSYVTGSHSYKAGFQMEENSQDSTTYVNRNVNYSFRNGVPVSLTQWATPYRQQQRIRADLGVFVQDQWTIKRLTLNYGVRFDYFNGYVPPQELAATTWVPARSFTEVKNVPNWKDVDPRLGAAYDLFGNGRTALKATISRYVQKSGTTIAGANNPVQTSVNNVTRAWNDANGNYIPDCDLGNRAANGECGAMSNQNFGGLRVTTRYADDAIYGFGARGSNWDLSTEVQHQLSARMSVIAGYYRNWYSHFTVTDNLAVTPSDYTPYCVTAPTDPRLPGGGGYKVCGLYDLNPSKFGQVNNLVTQASNFGKQTRANNFVNFSFNSRFRAEGRLGGGVDLGHSVDDNCFVVDSPQQLLNCHVVTPFEAQAQVKLYGSFPLPGGVIVSGILQNMSGPEYQATYTATNAEIAPSLGRNLSGGATTATVPLVVPQTLFDGRISRLDVRLTKQIRLGRRPTLQANLDLYNVLNGSAVLLSNSNFGREWRKPNAVLEARLIQFSTRLSF